MGQPVGQAWEANKKVRDRGQDKGRERGGSEQRREMAAALGSKAVTLLAVTKPKGPKFTTVFNRHLLAYMGSTLHPLIP